MSKLNDILSNVFGGGLMESAAKIVDQVVTNKEEAAQAKLALDKELNRHKETLRAQVYAHEAALLQDNDSARQREVALRNTIGVWVQNIAACVVIAAFVALVFVVIYKKTAVENIELVYTVIGSLGTVVVQIFQYWFGSSAGSVAKDQRMEMMRR